MLYREESGYFVSLFSLMFIIFSFNPVSAQENTSLNYKAEPQKTCYGNGGIAKIEYMGSVVPYGGMQNQVLVQHFLL